MAIATLLLREESTTSLSSIAEKSQSKKPPFLEYELNLNDHHLELILTSNSERILKSTSSDEGFESDIDSLSIVSSDDSFTNVTAVKSEIDSANGGSSSESDTDSKNDGTVLRLTNACKESYNLVNILCYTDVKYPDILVFVIRNVTYVFRFATLAKLQNFYANFTAVKAVANQKAYNKNFPAKFNLLQRTDNNGITHIEITKSNEGPSSIISINTPEDRLQLQNNSSGRVKDVNTRQRQESRVLELEKSSSSDNILKQNLVKTKDDTLRKVWGSADDLLDTPKRPERRRKMKGKAPLPPTQKTTLENQSIYSGQFVRVNVNFDVLKDDKNRLVIKSTCDEPHPKKLQNFKPTLSNFLRAKPEPKVVPDSSWTNSVPRLLKKPKSKSDTRQFIPMAYRYIDTTQNYPTSYTIPKNYPQYPYASGFSSIGRKSSNSLNLNNRLFGLSSKLRDFSGHEVRNEEKWSTSESATNTNLKSVIKKEDTKKKNDKKVTFSAYTTVQVV
ncbi:unnamed protein product [Brassicogethes aeneus]|uniref:Uncharacterized protein n=1 Tax=Brassicogethes aeneus TaxID=1431903 RepID=A0A9P0ATV0_BRAAE|nr:unnamed protein product [Brassicogethes aeneus]